MFHMNIMSKKIILVSDNHYNGYVLKDIVNKHYDADYYLHCGDSEMPKEEIRPFVSVRGNNDRHFDLPKEMILNIEGFNILVLHGHGYVNSFTYSYIFDYLEKKNIDLVFFGHTHIYADFTHNNIRYINPGSCNYPRDGSYPSYAEIILNNGNIEVIKHTIEGGKLC